MQCGGTKFDRQFDTICTNIIAFYSLPYIYGYFQYYVDQLITCRISFVKPIYLQNYYQNVLINF